MIVRKGSTAESTSMVSLPQYQILRYWPQIARDETGEPLISADLLALISQPRINGRGEANVSVRGVSPHGRALRPQVQLVAGRWFTPGKREVVVSRKMARRFASFHVGDTFRTGGHWLTVVGEFSGANTAFDSELWMDADESRALFDRQEYSSLLVRAASPGPPANSSRASNPINGCPCSPNRKSNITATRPPPRSPSASSAISWPPPCPSAPCLPP